VRFRPVALLIPILALALDAAPNAARETEDVDAVALLDKAKVEAREIPLQALALVRHAWPEEPLHPAISALAREQLIDFGLDGFAALRWAVVNVPARFQADAVAAMFESRDKLPHEIPPEYLPALEETVWFSSVEAKRLALPELTNHRYQPALMSMVDAAYMHPEIRLDVIQALGKYKSDRVRHFLLKMLREGTPVESHAAAVSLARIGERALGTLREATRDDVAQARAAAVRALLPISNVEDLTLLHEWVALHAGDDGTLAGAVTQRTTLLELVLDRKIAAEAASTGY